MKIEKLLNDDQFMNQVRGITNPEDAVKLFAEYGIQVSAAELAAVMGEEELDETTLDNVAGGGWLIDWILSFANRRSEKNAKDIDQMLKNLNKK